jgi:hypothetical protein
MLTALSVQIVMFWVVNTVFQCRPVIWYQYAEKKREILIPPPTSTLQPHLHPTPDICFPGFSLRHITFSLHSQIFNNTRKKATLDEIYIA